MEIQEKYREALPEDGVFALDIGTRSIIGMVGIRENDKIRITAIERAEHSKRAMVDGQIEDIEQVASIADQVKKKLEDRLNYRLNRVCVAAAGRALKTEHASYEIELPTVTTIDDELISQLEAGAIGQAEENFRDANEVQQDKRRFYLVGYTVCQYYLDNYLMSSLKDHHGQKLKVDIIATFLPSEVVESLYTTMHKIGLEIASLTLEPIAAINAAIPENLRLLNLVLVDIGAGTSDIAACRDGSVIGYTMATVAGDEITEAIMKEYLVDFPTAERIKAELEELEEIHFTDILGFDQSLKRNDFMKCIQNTTARLCQEISEKIMEVNGGRPSAVFLAGGGSRLAGLKEGIVEALDMDPKRVAVAGNNFQISACSDTYDINNPEYATPLGIAISAGLNLINDSFLVTLNGKRAKLFRSGSFTARDILMMNGYSYQDMIGRSGRNLTVLVNGKRVLFHGSQSIPAVLQINKKEGRLSDIVHAGDNISFLAASPGKEATACVRDLEGIPDGVPVTVNGEPAFADTPLANGDIVEFEGWEEAEPAETSYAEENIGKEPGSATADADLAALSGAASGFIEPEPAASFSTPVSDREPKGTSEPIYTGFEEQDKIFSDLQTQPGRRLSKPYAPAPGAAPSAQANGSPASRVFGASDRGTSEPVSDAHTRTQVSGAPGSYAPVPGGSAGSADGQYGPIARRAPQTPKTIAPDGLDGDTVTFELNGSPLTLPRKKDRLPYYLMDMLEHSGLDFDHITGTVVLEVNGKPGTFQQALKYGDSIAIYER